jgi:hypothetical protein
MIINFNSSTYTQQDDPSNYPNFSDFLSSKLPPSGTVILEPSWLAKVVITVVREGKDYQNGNGILTSADFSSIWRNARFPGKLHRPLVSLLEVLDIAFRLPSTFSKPRAIPMLFNESFAASAGIISVGSAGTSEDNQILIPCLLTESQSVATLASTSSHTISRVFQLEYSTK